MYESKRCERVVLRFPRSSDFTLERGVGVNWHHNWFPNGAPRDSAPPIDDSERWDTLLSELTVARPSCLRFGYAARRFTNENGAIDFGAEGFEALARLDAWAAKHNCILCFDPWMIPPAHSFGTGTDGSVADAPADPQRYVDEFLVPVMEHIRNTLNLRSVRDFILLNEPLTYGEDGTSRAAFSCPEGIDRFSVYFEVHRLLRQRMSERDIDFNVIGPDTNSTLYWAVDYLRDRDLDLTPFIDAYDQHSYWVRFDYLPPNPSVAATVPVGDNVDNQIRTNARFARSHGKPYYITELGTFYYGWRRGDPFGPARHDAVILEAEMIVRCMAVGVGGFYRWAFIAPGEYGDGVWAFVNTVDDSYTRQPNTFYGYAALMRYTEHGSRVWVPESSEEPSTYRHIHAVGLELPDGSHTIIVVNNHWAQERVIDIDLPDSFIGSHYQRLLTDSTRKMWRLEVGTANRLEAVAPPMSVLVFTDARRPGDQDFPEDTNVPTTE